MPTIRRPISDEAVRWSGRKSTRDREARSGKPRRGRGRISGGQGEEAGKANSLASVSIMY